MNDNHTGRKPDGTSGRHSWWESLRDDLADRFNLSEDSARQEETVDMICRGVEFRGINLWVLIFATMIASLGLNVNSAAVIIGAMLISPLMGPIMGVGLSLGINDFDLLKKSLRNFSLMVVVAIATSTLYFFISPLGTARSELLARTVPTTYDVLIAFFGGLAGIVAQSRKDRNSTVIPGVAIAHGADAAALHGGFRTGHGAVQVLHRSLLPLFHQHGLHRAGDLHHRPHAEIPQEEVPRSGARTLCQAHHAAHHARDVHPQRRHRAAHGAGVVLRVGCRPLCSAGVPVRAYARNRV